MKDVTVTNITDDEILFRRIPDSTQWYDPSRDPALEPEAFRANRNDFTGISLARGKYASIEAAARGRPGKTYYVAVLRAGDIRAAGMRVEPRPLPNDPSHAEIIDLTYEGRKAKQAIEWRYQLATVLTRSVEGPFSTPAVSK